jgi:hypothetical protein
MHINKRATARIATDCYLFLVVKNFDLDEMCHGGENQSEKSDHNGQPLPQQP